MPSKTIAPKRARASRGPGNAYGRIVANAPIGIYQSTFKRLRTANAALAAMFGYDSPAEMLAASDNAEDYFIEPEQRRRVVDEALSSTKYVQRVVTYRRKDGSTFVGSLRMRSVRDEFGKPQFFEGFLEDITEHKRLEEQFRQAQKMEAIGQLAGGVAHDFNNLLAASMLHLGMLQQNSNLDAATRNSLRDIEQETMRGANLVRQLLLFSRRQSARIELLDLNETINGILKMLRRLLGENIVLSFEPASANTWINADAGMMEQVVMNLCINARDAMPKGGLLAVATRPVDVPAERARFNPDARAGRFVCLSVSDMGCGMDSSVLKRLFEPFFTTKGVDKGTGLGLATVYGIVKKHEGWIEVQSEVGKGSEFKVFLPASPAAGVGIAPSSPAAQPMGGSETILLVEDEELVRRATALCLRKFGYAVLEAGDAAAAIEVWRGHRNQIALLFTDMVMPGSMTGEELACELINDNPKLAVVISSGYRADSGKTPVLDESRATRLPKPFCAALLAQTVRNCLDNPKKT